MFLVDYDEAKSIVRKEQRRAGSEHYVAFSRFRGLSYGFGSISSACSGFPRMEHDQPLSEICIKTVFQLSAEGDFRDKVEDVSLCVHGLACKLHVYFGLARSCHSMQKYRHSVA